MEDTFQVPARPWGEAEVAFLTANADLLNAETRAELGIVEIPVVEDFRAEVDSAFPDRAVEPEVVDVSTLTKEEIADGKAAFDALPVEDQEAARKAVLTTGEEVTVVDNNDADKA